MDVLASSRKQTPHDGSTAKVSSPLPDQSDLSHQRDDEHQRERLQLELVRVRRQAEAARLDARAATIELMLRELGYRPSSRQQSASVPQQPASDRASQPPLDESSVPSPGPSKDPPEIITARRFASWDEVRDELAASRDRDEPPPASGIQAKPSAFEQKDPAFELNPTDPENTPDRARRKPAAWMISLVAHVTAVLALAAITLHRQRPKDQLALTASPSEPNEVAIESLTIEASEPVTETSEPIANDTAVAIDPAAELPAIDFAPQSTPRPPTNAESALKSTTAAAESLRASAHASIQFCGVEGGGNHFVYLVDSSASMGEAFDSARRELLRSVDALQPQQRFYVIFFDAQSDYMRLSDPNQDEPYSMLATPQNKAALKRWAMQISPDRGKAPYEPLEFALELRPDVIFLLSDGEFPQGIEDLLREQNRVQNLFGDSHPICIVHTIGYHSKAGESRMKRIAVQNDGHYRHIAAP